MASSSQSQLLTRVTCSICMEQFDNESHLPKRLPCWHAFCQACIIQRTEQSREMWRPPSMKCPICWIHSDIPEGGFKTIRAILDIVDELQKDTLGGKPSSIIKCKKHANKKVAYVCIDCLDSFCTTCATSSIHIQAKHHVEEVAEAIQVLQQRFKISQQHLFEKNLSMLKQSPCSSTEITKAEADITSMGEKLHEVINTWVDDQIVMLSESNARPKALERANSIEWNSGDNDLETLLLMMQQSQQHIDVDDDFMNKLYKCQAEDQSKFDQSLSTLPSKVQAEIESLSAIQSKYLKKAASVTSTEPRSLHMNSVAEGTRDKRRVHPSKRLVKNRVMSTVVLYKVMVTRPDWIDPEEEEEAIFMAYGDVIAVTEDRGEGLIGFNQRTGYVTQVGINDVHKIT